MATAGLNDVKKGMKILHNNDPWIITEAEFIKPGKGQAFTRIFIRNLKTGRTSEQTMKSSDSYEVADVTDTDMQYLYSDGEFWHFMQQETFEQHQAGKAGMGDAAKWLKGEEECVVTLFNGEIIAVQAPNSSAARPKSRQPRKARAATASTACSPSIHHCTRNASR